MEKEQIQAQLHTTLQNADIEEFVNLAKQAIETYPEEAFANYYFGEALTVVPNPEYALAEQYFSKSLDLDADNLECWFKYANSQEQQLDFENAANTYQLILQKDPENIQVLSILAIYYSKQGKNLNNALYYINQLMDLEPERNDLYILRGEAYCHHQKYEEALEDLQYAMSEEFSEEGAVLQVEILKVLNRQTETFALYEGLIETSPNTFAYHYDYAVLLHNLLEFEQAFPLFKRVLEIMPEEHAQNPLILKPIADNFMEMGAYSEALNLYNICIQATNTTTDKDFYIGRAAAKKELADFEGALSDLKIAIQMAADNEFIQTIITLQEAEVLLDMNKEAEAEELFKKFQAQPLFKTEGNYGMMLVEYKRGNMRESYQLAQKAQAGGHPKAKKFIETKLATYLDKIRKNVFAKYSPEVSKNEQSPLLKSIIGKLWVVDNIRVPAIQDLNKLPAEAEAQLRIELQKNYLLWSATEIFYHPPYLGGEDKPRNGVYAYKIMGEKGNLIQIQATSSDGESTIQLKIKIDNAGVLFLDKTDKVEELIMFKAKDAGMIPKTLRTAFLANTRKIDRQAAANSISGIVEDICF
jgi:tetratricopeptide (TPR) repeat protein